MTASTSPLAHGSSRSHHSVNMQAEHLKTFYIKNILHFTIKDYEHKTHFVLTHFQKPLRKHIVIKLDILKIHYKIQNLNYNFQRRFDYKYHNFSVPYANFEYFLQRDMS